jgi:hypothetical protein
VPPEQRSIATKNGGADAAISKLPTGRQRELRRIFRTQPRPQAIEEAETAGFNPEQIEQAIQEIARACAKR